MLMDYEESASITSTQSRMTKIQQVCVSERGRKKMRMFSGQNNVELTYDLSRSRVNDFDVKLSYDKEKGI